MAHTKDFIAAVSDILVKNHVIPASESPRLQQLFQESEEDYYDYFLLREGFVDRADLLKALADYYHVPSFDVTGYFFDHHTLRKFPKDFLLRNEVVPLEVDTDMLIVVAAHPDKEGLSAALRTFVSYDIEYRVGIATDIIDAVEEYYDQSLLTDALEREDRDGDDDYAQEKIIDRDTDFVLDTDEMSMDDDIRQTKDED